ncbi:MAG: hypothetical protein ACQ9MH_13140 [Nitrospinales bacterium]
MSNLQLKIIVVQDGRNSYEIERAAGFWPGKLSKFIGGALDPTNAEKVALAKVLGKRVDELFPKNQ